MTLGKAITIRAAFTSIKRQLADAGYDISKIKSFSDLPSILAGSVTEDMMEQAAELLADEETMEALLGVFEAAAKTGALVSLFQAPDDRVNEGDIFDA